eukprot:CAMPEP_0175051192 /NCGR_PEP_ID=MMETSP0052_2-20121109/7658_1 /TAXON_ID=51329 ORGANISM="Polytomella parva, Strain SAG 63-3" /NCGR_SAMPLE_ID=MMETSP0052_2 /ASSEMBLY_ACC=CAM_ASM_000194 /LENGTH=62 /DNA_ID=CAMNT_0016315439 /DNA_START=370 /DNA_END=555 /DNA_ORIENTATION=-
MSSSEEPWLVATLMVLVNEGLRSISVRREGAEREFEFGEGKEGKEEDEDESGGGGIAIEARW